MSIVRARVLPACLPAVGLKARRGVVVALGVAFGAATLMGQSAPRASTTPDTEWRVFGSDAGATRYSPANQITATNVRDLRVAWRWSARNFGSRPATSMQ